MGCDQRWLQEPQFATLPPWGKRFRIMTPSFRDVLTSHLTLRFWTQSQIRFLLSIGHLPFFFLALLKHPRKDVFVLSWVFFSSLFNIINGCQVARPHLQYLPTETDPLHWLFRQRGHRLIEFSLLQITQSCGAARCFVIRKKVPGRWLRWG